MLMVNYVLIPEKKSGQTVKNQQARISREINLSRRNLSDL